MIQHRFPTEHRSAAPTFFFLLWLCCLVALLLVSARRSGATTIAVPTADRGYTFLGSVSSTS